MEASAADELMSGARRPASVTEEDYVAMVGQGTIADRSSNGSAGPTSASSSSAASGASASPTSSDPAEHAVALHNLK